MEGSIDDQLQAALVNARVHMSINQELEEKLRLQDKYVTELQALLYANKELAEKESVTKFLPAPTELASTVQGYKDEIARLKEALDMTREGAQLAVQTLADQYEARIAELNEEIAQKDSRYQDLFNYSIDAIEKLQKASDSDLSKMRAELAKRGAAPSDSPCTALSSRSERASSDKPVSCTLLEKSPMPDLQIGLESITRELADIVDIYKRINHDELINECQEDVADYVKEELADFADHFKEELAIFVEIKHQLKECQAELTKQKQENEEIRFELLRMQTVMSSS
jgi:hypothetical protein